MGLPQGLFRTLWRMLSKEVKEHVGTDHFGNKYYYVPQYTNWRGQIIRDKRIIEAAKKNEISYEVGDIPIEWEAWIRRKRNTPPTMEVVAAPGQSRLPTPSNAPHSPSFHASLPAVLTRTQQWLQEILKNEEYRQQMKIKSKDFYEKEKLLSQETNEELLPPPVQTQIKGHASAPYFGKEEPSATPTSTGKTFQPGSWVPQDGKSHNQ
ncbi:NADH dehydrogenase [ubiquinone] 1 alpha subcomplex assembly factor 2 isoform X1 [Cavia porcellus]|uniref:NADH dehydrogenase [ubiquinone] 1 alpha subcomplex assembly factor 2 isoform X1 n=1 Tax=Cavia porcellus TaxID=10141 RepID=UPI002FE01324